MFEREVVLRSSFFFFAHISKGDEGLFLLRSSYSRPRVSLASRAHTRARTFPFYLSHSSRSALSGPVGKEPTEVQKSALSGGETELKPMIDDDSASLVPSLPLLHLVSLPFRSSAFSSRSGEPPAQGAACRAPCGQVRRQF